MRERDCRYFFYASFLPACFLSPGALPSLEGRVGGRGWRAGGREEEKERERV